jgi:ATP-dependent Clp protease ATP-binding subunit ClpA
MSNVSDWELPTMYERFTDRARKVMQLANKEAQRFNHEYIGTEHILLGLVQEGSGVGANVLKNLDIDLRKIRLEIEKIVQSGPHIVSVGKLPQTPTAKKVIDYSIEEARSFKHNYVGTEHLLLGLMREEEGIAAQILINLGLRLQDLREEVANLLGHPSPEQENLDRQRLRSLMAKLDLPSAVGRMVEELNAEIERLTVEKEEAVADQDFQRAADLRDLVDRLKKERETRLSRWFTQYHVDRSWLEWNGGAVAQLAQAIADQKRWADLPLLADTLEKAGCTDNEILDHCRQPGEHVDYCWVIDLLLARPGAWNG